MSRRPLFALTVRQPWASAIAYGPKRIENRTWPLPSSAGPWLALHAGKRRPTRAEQEELWPDLRQHWPAVPDASALPLGALLGLVRVEACPALEDAPHLTADPWACGPVCWLIAEVITLDTPIPMGGKQGLWRVPAHALEPLRAAWRQSRPRRAA